jgi:hypothetical protein
VTVAIFNASAEGNTVGLAIMAMLGAMTANAIVIGDAENTESGRANLALISFVSIPVGSVSIDPTDTDVLSVDENCPDVRYNLSAEPPTHGVSVPSHEIPAPARSILLTSSLVFIVDVNCPDVSFNTENWPAIHGVLVPSNEMPLGKTSPETP